MFLNKKTSLISGLICGLSFAPVFFTPAIFMLSVLCYQISKAPTRKQAMIFSYLFGLGFFLSSLYWIAFGVSVYINEFWWAIPFALFGLPAFLALFTSAQAAYLWSVRSSSLYHFLFCCSWVFTEWLMSWIFTGLPWSVIGYALSASDTLIQSASIFGIFGLSFATVYVGSIFFSKKTLPARGIISVIIFASIFAFGYDRLQTNQTELSEIKVRIVQPSIPQIDKWDPDIFWDNFSNQIALSQKEGGPDLIVWSEAALTVPYHYKPVYHGLMSLFTHENQVLISGGVSDNGQNGDGYEIYSSMFALSSKGNTLFDYHKSHLVPFGEYMPLAQYLPVKKLTPGILDYTPGNHEIVYLSEQNLYIQPLICYESIFPEEDRISNENADVIINITNDAWYGNSSGPYQHFEISRMRSIENGLPMIRAGNNGISAIIDPLGRVLQKLELNKIDILDGNIPLKLVLPTIYSEWGLLAMLSQVVLVLIMQSTIVFLSRLIYN
ncbi:apolipoprotein N-acyltransferase [Rickettsiaceae bacterium]|nr:apolipoprotein N-acyltransferase [Rickettsiaceae bacterium]